MQLAVAISDRRAAVLARRPEENVDSFTNEPQGHQRGTERVPKEADDGSSARRWQTPPDDVEGEEYG